MTVVWKIVPQKIDPNVGSHPLIKDPAAGLQWVPQTIIPDIRLNLICETAGLVLAVRLMVSILLYQFQAGNPFEMHA